MPAIWIVLFLGFGFAVDYTTQNNHIPKINIVPDVRMEMTVHYYDVIDSIGYDGLHIMSQDSVVYYDRVRGEDK